MHFEIWSINGTLNAPCNKYNQPHILHHLLIFIYFTLLLYNLLVFQTTLISLSLSLFHFYSVFYLNFARKNKARKTKKKMVGMKISMQASLLLCATFTALLSQSFAISSTTYEDQKHYYSPDPSSGRPPSGFSFFFNFCLTSSTMSVN